MLLALLPNAIAAPVLLALLAGTHYCRLYFENHCRGDVFYFLASCVALPIRPGRAAVTLRVTLKRSAAAWRKGERRGMWGAGRLRRV